MDVVILVFLFLDLYYAALERAGWETKFRRLPQYLPSPMNMGTGTPY